MSKSRIAFIAFRLGISLFIMGALFKLLHYEFSDIFISITLFIISVSYVFRYLLKPIKLPLDHIKLILVVSWCIQAAFGIFHLPYRLLFTIISAASTILWFIYEGPLVYINRDSKQNPMDVQTPKSYKGVMSVFYLGITIAVVGILFKLMHWPGAGSLLISGIILSGISFLSTFLKKS